MKSNIGNTNKNNVDSSLMKGKDCYDLPKTSRFNSGNHNRISPFVEATTSTMATSPKLSEKYTNEFGIGSSGILMNSNVMKPLLTNSNSCGKNNNILNTFDKINYNNSVDMVSIGGEKMSSTASLQQLSNIAPQATILPQDNNSMTNATALNLAYGHKNPPITLNADEPIEVSDDSNDNNIVDSKANASNINQQSFMSKQQSIIGNIDGSVVNDEMVVPPNDTILSSKQLKKLRKQMRKSSNMLPANILAACEQGDGVGKLAGGADLIPLSSTGMAYSSKSVPFNSLTASANPAFGGHTLGNRTQHNLLTVGGPNVSTMFNNTLTITPTAVNSTMMSTDNNCIISSNSGAMGVGIGGYEITKKHKEHKKMKKLKDGKVKKKKDKKDKSKKGEKYIFAQEQQTHQQQQFILQQRQQQLQLQIQQQQQQTQQQYQNISSQNILETNTNTTISISSLPSDGGITNSEPAVTITPTATLVEKKQKDKHKDKDLLRKLKKEKKKEKRVSVFRKI